jgi:hypothetical protein
VALLACVAALWAGSGSPRMAIADVHVGFTPASLTVAPGDSFLVQLSIIQADSSFNAFDASIRFDPSRLTFKPTTPVSAQRGVVMTSVCSNTFHRFDVGPDSLKITLSLLCNQTYVTGPGTIYKVWFRAGMAPGTTTLSLGPFTEFYHAGLFVRPLDKQTMVVHIVSTTGVQPGSAQPGKLQLAPPAPNPHKGRGSVLLDFTLPAPDDVGIEVLDLQGRRVAGRAAERFGEGRHQFAWTSPPLADGAYFLRLTTRSAGSAVRPWVVLR